MARLAFSLAFNNRRLLDDLHVAKADLCSSWELPLSDYNDVHAEHSYAANLSKRSYVSDAKPRWANLLLRERLPRKERRIRWPTIWSATYAQLTKASSNSDRSRKGSCSPTCQWDRIVCVWLKLVRPAWCSQCILKWLQWWSTRS